MVSVPGPHTPSPEFKIARAAQVGDVGYFEGVMGRSRVNAGSEEGDWVDSTALEVVEWLSERKSDKVWVFDDAQQVGFGDNLINGEYTSTSSSNGAEIIPLQTRAGAGSSLAGFLSSASTTGTLTLLSTTSTLPHLLPILNLLPTRPDLKIIIHLATTTIDPTTLIFRNSLDRVVEYLPSIPLNKFDVNFLGTAEEILKGVSSGYEARQGNDNNKHVINIIESTFAGRQVSSLQIPSSSSSTTAAAAATEYKTYGDLKTATTILVLPSGHVSNLIIPHLSGSTAALILNTWDQSSSLSQLLQSGSSSTDNHHQKKSIKLVLVNESEEARMVLKENVLSAIYDPSGSSSKSVFPRIQSVVVPSSSSSGNTGSSEKEVIEFLATEIPGSVHTGSSKGTDQVKTVSFFTSPTEPLPELLAQMFGASPALRSTLDRFGSSVAQGVKSVLSLRPVVAGKKQAQVVALPITSQGEESDVVWITEPQIIKQNDIFSSLKPNALLVLVVPWSEEEVPNKLTRAERELIRSRNVRVFLLSPTENPIVQQVAFLMLYTSSKKLSEGVEKVLSAYYDGNLSREAIEEAQANLTEVAGVSEWKVDVDEADKDKEEVEKAGWEWDAVPGKRGVVDTLTEGKPTRGDWALAAKHFLFKEAFEYGVEVDRDEELKEKAILELRPSLEDKTYLVKVSENRRLTPETYDRNVFHIAFDTSGTGLKYEVGEALGIHGWNDEKEVREFIEWYGLNAGDLVSVPSPHDNGATYETRTVFQLMQQNLDVFGKPGKSFYASLSALAKNKNEERTLRFIAAPEGVALFKKMSEVETVTFADVLRQFKSARPSIEELVGLIPEIKPRHYSIASSNAAVGDLVELLVVTVDWATPSGTPRYGQCTRYLAALPVGAQVTVSIKPSVMKLPPLDTQPIIMAGLGTGAAPFRAFIQHRAWQKSQGIEVGPLVYYFGSRYRSQEYLYVSHEGE
jgi:sulfite reductase (NADPH) flavoprotein alpha-component